MQRLGWGTFAALVALALGCKSDPAGLGDTGGPAGPGTLEVTGPATVRAGGAPVEFTVVTDVGASAVAWSVVPASAGTIAGTGSTGTFTPAAVVAASTAFEVVATAGASAGRASSTLLPPLGPVTLDGKVVDMTGAPVSGAKVIVGAQVRTTAAAGTFTFASITPPYEVTVVAGSGLRVGVFRGVESAAPVLTLEGYRLGQSRGGYVQGKVTLGGVPAAGARVIGPFASAPANASGDYSLFSIWVGAASQTVTHRALGIGVDSALRPQAYWYAARDVPVVESATVTAQDFALAALAAGNVTGTSTAVGDTLDAGTFSFSAAASFPDGAAYTLYDRHFSLSDLVIGDFAVVVPSLPEGKVRVGFTASDLEGGSTSAHQTVAPGQSGVALVTPLIPVSGSPADGAAGVGYATPLAWTSANAGGMDQLDVTCHSGVYTIEYDFHGGARSATLPDLSAYGVPLAAGASCTWYAGWRSHTLEQFLLGPAAIDALATERHAFGAKRAFTF